MSKHIAAQRLASGASERPRVPQAFFDALYANDEDPWGFATRDYEREKYAHTLSCLGDARFGRGLEIGCSIGVLSERLAEICDELVGIDVSERALDLARSRLRDRANVTFVSSTFPEQMPNGPWDLIVCSEVLYYLDAPAFALALTRLREAIDRGAAILVVHWRPPTETYPMRGDDVHDKLVKELRDWHLIDDRRECYRLDLFGPTSTGQATGPRRDIAC